MSESKSSRFSLEVSIEYIMQWLALTLIINLGLFTIVHFLLNQYDLGWPNPERYSKIIWVGFTLVGFTVFALTYIFISAPRYWVDTDSIEIRSVYRSKKSKIVEFEKIVDMKIRKTPILSNIFNFGTIVFYNKTEDGKKKVVARFLGVKYPNEVYLEILENLDIEEEKKIEDLLL
ncbi:MAG: PH domain-containing protein [Candidatus Heimdallarchaeota archaeon]